VVTLRDNLLVSTTAVTVLLGLLAVGVSILLIRSGIIAPLAQLELAAQQMAAGNYQAHANVQTGDEIGQLAQAFNTMADRLHQYTSQLIVELKQRVVEAQTARERAERSDKVKSAFLASVSHELRTPLNSVINFTKFVTKGVMGPINDRQKDSLDKVINSAKHLLHLINDVLDISKIESGSLTLFVEENIDLTEILRTAISTAEGLLTEKPVKLLQEIDPGLQPITGDRQRILQIMLNIVSNACKFTEKGFIKITAHQRDNEFYLAIQDSGPGIDPKDQAAVFAPFKQTETGLRQGEGTGLGMPISKSLAEAHGGRLWFDSAVGEGTTFYVSLPIKSTQLTPVPA
jgi:signal transduction histidine kinase